MSPKVPRAFVTALNAWYRRAGRDLPWRRTRDPYAIWLSEVMLQQTRVETVVPYFVRFLARFPDIGSLAAASGEEVLKLWEGLGYYRRALFLLRGAKVVAALGRWPSDPEGLEAIPGVGPYTAAAVASIAFGVPVGVLDGNVRRVWSRVFALDDARSSGAMRELRRLSDEAAALGPPAEVNQALMELGATLCSPKVPSCPACPVARWCASASDGLAESRPSARPRRILSTVEVAVGLLWKGGRFLVQRRAEGGFLGGLWELPGGKLMCGETPEEALVREFSEELGISVKVTGSLPPVRHAYSHFRVRLHPFHCEAPGATPRHGGDSAVRWIRPDEVGALPFPAGTHKVFALAWPPGGRSLRAADYPARYRLASGVGNAEEAIRKKGNPS